MSPAPIGLIVNPRSRALRRHPELATSLRETLGARGLAFESRDPSGLAAAAATLHAAAVPIVGIVGGDGTAGLVIAALREAYGATPLPAIALLRGGTMNTVANALSVPRRAPPALLLRLLRLAARPAVPTRARLTLSAGPRIGFLFGTGVFQAFLHAYYERGSGDPTALTAAQTILHLAASALARGPAAHRVTAPTALRLEIDGHRHPDTPYMAVTAGTVSQVGLGFRPFYRADALTDAFHMLAITGTPPSVALDLPKIWLGRSLAARNGFDRAATTMRLIPEGASGVDFMVDGDVYHHEGPLTVALGPTIQLVDLAR